jgi:hypothetical protein
MIYCDREIEKAIKNRRLIIDPLPEPSQFDSTSNWPAVLKEEVNKPAWA